jgi:putative phage-type endonuclease
MKIIDLEQNSPPWYTWRDGGIGASESAAILGNNPWQSREQIFLAKQGEWKYEENENTRRGKKLEPEARELYERLYGYKMTPICGVHDTHDFIRASLDGYRDDGKLILELKCPRPENHNLWHREGIPSYYEIQIQHQLLVSGSPLAHFVSYCPQVVKRCRLLVVPVKADPEFHSLLIRELAEFWSEVTEKRLAQ